MDWNDLRFFLAVAETKSLSAAALRLQVSASTVSRRLEALQLALKAQLFTAHQSGYDLTPTGRALVPLAERAEAQMRVFERSAQDDSSATRGTVSLEAPELLAQEVLLPGLADFLHKNAAITLQLNASVRNVRLAGEEADIILRLARPDRGRYRQRRIGQIEFGLYASPDHARLGVPTDASDLGRCRVIGWPEKLRHLAMARWLEGVCPQFEPALALSSLGLHLTAAHQGLGWALLPTFAAQGSDLVQGLSGVPPLVTDLWLLVHEQSADVPRVRRVVDELTHVLARFRDAVDARGARVFGDSVQTYQE